MEYTTPIHHPYFTSSLVIAGLVPTILDFSSVFTFLYYAILIPPAAFQCYMVCKNQFIPFIIGWFKSKDSS